MESNLIDWNRKRAIDTFKAIKKIRGDIEKKAEQIQIKKEKQLKQQKGEEYQISETIKKEIEDEKKKYIEEQNAQLLAICRKLSMEIRDNGLVTVLAFYMKKTEEGESQSVGNGIGQAVEAWVKGDFLNTNNMENLLNYMATCNLQEYKFLTKEAMEYAIWLKRNAEGMIKSVS